MKSYFLKLKVAVVFFVLPLVSLAQIKGDTYAQAQSTKKANLVYVFSNTPGFMYANGSSYAGICVDIMGEFEKYVKAKHGISISSTYRREPNDYFQKMLQDVRVAQGGVFGLGNITITEARKKQYTFSPAFINNISLLITHKSAPSLQKIEDIATVFKGMKGYAVKGSTNEARMLEIKRKYYPDLQIVYVKSIPGAVKMVEEDPKSFTNADFTYYLDGVKKKKPIKRHVAGASGSEEFGILMPKNNDWAPVLADFLNSGFLTSPTYKAIIRKHLGESAIKLLESVKK